jgi:hypothetical protein
MATIKLNAFASDGELEIKAVRDDEDGNVVLVIEAGDDHIEITVGRTVADADNLAGQLAGAMERTVAISEDWYDVPDDTDLWVSLDRGSWFVSWDGKNRPGQPERGYPSRTIAIYEAARWQAEAGQFSPAWVTGEHGPAAEEISSEIRAWHDESGEQMLPLPGVRYQDATIVHVEGETWPTWVVVRDYGELGVVVHAEGDPSVWTQSWHDQLSEPWAEPVTEGS